MSKNDLMYTSEIKTAKKREKMRRKELKKRTGSVHRKNVILDPMKLITVAACCVIFAMVCCAAVLGIEVVYSIQVQELQSQIRTLEDENHQLALANTELKTDRDTSLIILEEVSKIAVELDTDNIKLMNTIDELNDTIEWYESREELFNKYEWALLDGSNRTDITYDNILMLQNLTEEENISEDVVDLILALSMTEARGNEDAKNPESSASGYGQFLYGTAKFVYEKLMGNGSGTYTHDMALDGELNLQMMVYYLEYLGDKYGNNITMVMDEYRGEHNLDYNRKVDRYLAKAGTDLNHIMIRP